MKTSPDPDQWLVDTGTPGGEEAGALNMFNRKLSHVVDAYRAACFWHQLLTVNPHIADLCAQQVKVQWGWACANVAECQRLNTWLTERKQGREDLLDIAQWWATECAVLLAECENYDPAKAPAWCVKRIAALDQDLVTAGRDHGWLVGNAPAIGTYLGLYAGKADTWQAGDPPEDVAYNQLDRLHTVLHEHGVSTTFEDGPPTATEAPSADLDFSAAQVGTEQVSSALAPLAIVEDRTTEQKIADGDMPAPTHCKSCNAALKMGHSGRGNARTYLYCAECSDPARYYVVGIAGKLMLDPKPNPKAERHTERTY